MSRQWPMVPLAEILTPVSRPESVEPQKTYKILGAHWYAQGLYIKDIKTGAEIRANKLFRVEKDDFVYNRLFAWKGSFAIATADDHGCYVSNEFPCFSIDRNRADGIYLWRYFNRLLAWDEALGLSKGGTPTSRNRLKKEMFLAIKVPLPPLSEQQRIVVRIEKLAAKIDEARDQRRETVKEVNLLFKRALQSIFKSGEPKTALSEVLQLHRGYDLPVQLRTSGPYPVFAANGEIARHAESRVRGPGVVTGRSGSVGAVNYVEEDYWPLNTALYVSDFKGNMPRLIYYLLCSVADDLKQISSHTAVPTLDRKKAHTQIQVHLPKSNRQQHVVTYLDDLQAKTDALKRLQAETATELDALLPAVLDRAFKGELL